MELPPSARPGDLLRGRLEVCNTGTDGWTGIDLSLYLSSDPVIESQFTQFGSTDFFLDSLWVDAIEAGQCRMVEFESQAFAREPGAYYFGVLVDEFQSQEEVDETNNTFVGPRIGIGFAPDLVVGDIHAPPSARPGDPLLVTVDVCNQGTEDAPTADVSLYLSVDDVLEGQPVGGPPADPLKQDVFLDQRSANWIPAGSCQALRFETWALVQQDGPHFVGAIVDEFESLPELIEDNNRTVGPVVGVGFEPDLVVQAIDTPPSVRPGDAYNPEVTVCNQGTTDAGPVEVMVLLSRDETIAVDHSVPKTSDFEVGFAQLNELFEGECRTAVVPGFAQAYEEGAHFVAAAVDPFETVPELREDNNEFIGPRIGVGNGPDLVVRTIQAPASVRPSDTARFVATVCNEGTDSTWGADLTLYLTADGQLEPQRANPLSRDFFLDQRPVERVEPGRCTDLVFESSVYIAEEGPHQVAAIVDEFDGVRELREDNNVFVGPTLGVGFGPDLVVQSIEAPASVRPGNPFNLEVSVCNQGTERSSWTELALYLSEDPELETCFLQGCPPDQGDFFLDLVPVDPLSAGTCRTIQTETFSHVPRDGLYFVGVSVDEIQAVRELREDNNLFTGSPLGVGHHPDLVVRTIEAPASARPGDPIRLVVQACNQGTEHSAPFEASLYLSRDRTLEGQQSGSRRPPEDVFLDILRFDQGLAPDRCDTRTLDATAHVFEEGPHFVGAIVDEFEAVPELRTDNNVFLGPIVGVGFGADLVVTSIEGPASATPWGELAATAVVCNQGTDRSGGAEVVSYLSEDRIIEVDFIHPADSDFPVAFGWVQDLAAGECREVELVGPAYAPEEGPRFLAVVVDPNGTQPELREDNNTTVGPIVGIGFGPDLVVEAFSGPNAVQPGASFDVSLSVCNQGTDFVPGAELWLYLSEDGTVVPESADPDSGDFIIGQVWVDGLSAGDCRGFDEQVQAFVAQDGLHVLVAAVDPFRSTREIREDNNIFVGDSIGVGFGPDLVINDVETPASVRPGSPFDLSFEVCNVGTDRSPLTEAVLYLSDDREIETCFDTGCGSFDGGDALLEPLTIQELDVGACRVVQTRPTVHVPDSGTHFLGISVDEFDSVFEVREDNNIFVGPQVAVGFGPDLVVEAIETPPSARPGDDMQISVTVCNQGTERSARSDLNLYLTEDETVEGASGPGLPDPFLDTVSIRSIRPGQCTEIQRTSPAAVFEPGPHFVAAVVDEFGGLPELREDNNTALSARLGIGFGADLVVRSLTLVQGGPSRLLAEMEVCNQGTEDAFGFEVPLYFLGQAEFPDSSLDPARPPVGSAFVPELAAGTCHRSTEEIWTAPTPTDGPFVGAWADAFQAVPELLEDNNQQVERLP